MLDSWLARLFLNVLYIISTTTVLVLSREKFGREGGVYDPKKWLTRLCGATAMTWAIMGDPHLEHGGYRLVLCNLTWYHVQRLNEM